MYFITKKTLVWVIVFLCALIAVIWLTSCGRGSVQPGADTPGFHGRTPGEVLTRLSLAATVVAGTVLIACGVLAVFLKGQLALIARLASACVLVIASAQVVYWLGAHIWVAVAGIAVVGVLWAWSHLKVIEKWIGRDLNADGKVG